jgi:hypothetical protein
MIQTSNTNAKATRRHHNDDRAQRDDRSPGRPVLTTEHHLLSADHDLLPPRHAWWPDSLPPLITRFQRRALPSTPKTAQGPGLSPGPLHWWRGAARDPSPCASGVVETFRRNVSTELALAPTHGCPLPLPRSPFPVSVSSVSLWFQQASTAGGLPPC